MKTRTKTRAVACALAALTPSFAGCNAYRHLMGDDTGKESVTVRYPSAVEVSWTDQQVYDALTWDQKNLLDKTAPFFHANYDAAWRPLYQAFLDGTGRNVFPQWFTDEQFRRVLVACVDLGKLDGLTL